MRSNVGGKGERERRESKREGGKVEYIGLSPLLLMEYSSHL